MDEVNSTDPAADALDRLKKGNARFVVGLPTRINQDLTKRRISTVGGQSPFAAILGCADSRVPVELVFDQNIGDLFVIRVAGNVATPTQIGSVEFAAAVLGTRLVVVLGHSSCGAVQATIDHLRKPADDTSPNLAAIVKRIQPAVEPLISDGVMSESNDLIIRAVRANVRAAVADLQAGSSIIEQLVREDGLQIIGAEYSLETGRVMFLENNDA